jgi:hypothetical protein
LRLDLDHAEAIAAALNEKLRPFAERRVDINDPSWMEKLRQSSPLDEAGVRDDAESLLRSLLEAYASGTGDERAAVRDVFRNNRAFAWATGLPEAPDTADGFRQHVLHVSVLAHVEDPRDLMVSVHELCASAKAAGVPIEPILSEVAALSEPIVRKILSSTR